MPRTWTDQNAFLAEDARRRTSDEVELGATWRFGKAETWTLSWIRDTGELYLVRNDSLVGTGSSLALITVIETEKELDAVLEGWDEARRRDDGLTWLNERLGVQLVV